MDFYALVYGPEWEDIMYFYDLEVAKKHLLVHSTKKGFFAVLYVYKPDKNGTFTMAQPAYMVDVSKMAEILKTTPNNHHIHDNPEQYLGLIQPFQ